MTINLEKELLSQNKKLATPESLLAIQEYEKHEALVEDDSLSRIGITDSLNKGRSEKIKINALKEQTLRFDKYRVFHISQIKSICIKYALRFLPSCLYKGTIDKELPFKINAFEAMYNIKCKSCKTTLGGIKGNTFIIAPPESFKLQEKPKDPLLFYQINDEYYYLIHKWGNDLNWLRIFKSDFGRLIKYSSIAMLITLAIMMPIYSFLPFEDVCLIIFLILITASLLISMIGFGGNKQNSKWCSSEQ